MGISCQGMVDISPPFFNVDRLYLSHSPTRTITIISCIASRRTSGFAFTVWVTATLGLWGVLLTRHSLDVVRRPCLDLSDHPSTSSGSIPYDLIIYVQLQYFIFPSSFGSSNHRQTPSIFLERSSLKRFEVHKNSIYYHQSSPQYHIQLSTHIIFSSYRD